VSRSAEQLLEFDRLKDIVSRYTTCAPGRRSTLALQVQQDSAALDVEFALVREAVAYLREGTELGFGSLADTEPWLARLIVPGSILVTGELLDVASLMDTARAVRQTFKEDAAKYPHLSERAAALVDFRHLSTAIRRAILPNGEISDDGSSQLKRIRENMEDARGKIHKSLEKILHARGQSTGEDYVTVRNDRFVIPPGVPDFRVEVHGSLPNDAVLLSFFPHMHLRGKRFEYNILHPGSAPEALLRVNYDFFWQLSYRLTHPLPLKAGTLLQAVAWYDNSKNNTHNPDPGVAVRWGDQTYDEMMVGFFDVAVPANMDKTRYFLRSTAP